MDRRGMVGPRRRCGHYIVWGFHRTSSFLLLINSTWQLKRTAPVATVARMLSRKYPSTSLVMAQKVGGR